MSENLSDHVAENRRYWDAMADQWVSGGERAWEQEARWGEWQIPNTELPLLTDDMHGLPAIELGCGTGYVSAWMRRRGVAVYAIDNSDAQLATARRLSERHGLDDIAWVHGNDETALQPGGSCCGPARSTMLDCSDSKAEQATPPSGCCTFSNSATARSAARTSGQTPQPSSREPSRGWQTDKPDQNHRPRSDDRSLAGGRGLWRDEHVWSARRSPPYPRCRRFSSSERA